MLPKIIAFLSVFLCFVFLSPSVYANHFRSGSMSWSSVDERTVLINVNVGWTNSHSHIPSSAAVGDVVANKLTLNFGDGQTEDVAVRVVSRNTVTNDVQTEAVSIKPGDSDYTAGILHTYATDGDYIANWGSTAREDAINLDGAPWRNETLVNIGGAYAGNNSPIGAIPSVIQVQDNTVFTTSLIAVDVDGDPIRFRYGTMPEFYNLGSGTASKPAGLQLNEDGSIIWDVRDEALMTEVGNRWQGTIMVEDLDEDGNVKSKIPLDFVFLISSSTDQPPSITGPSSDSYTITPDQTLEFSLTATDPDWDGALASPTVIALNPPTTDNTIWSMTSNSDEEETVLDVSFTPDASIAGKSYVVIFQGTDAGGNAAIKVVTMHVSASAPTATPTPRAEAPPQEKKKSTTDTPVCADAKPESVPDLFQIDVESTKATLHFTPVGKNVTNYFIAYGYNDGEERFGTPTGQGPSTGVLSYTIQHLDPSQEYSFTVRPQNGCMPGDWSNSMKIKTNSNGSTALTKHYKNFPSRILSIIPQSRTVLGSADQKTFVNDDHSHDHASGSHGHCSYRVNPGDSLWRIAATELGDGSKYTEIMKHNTMTSTFITPGQKLVFDCG